MSFPAKVKEDALVACSRCCCLCHVFCGTKIEVHHILKKDDGGDDSVDNAIALCFNCHADMRSYDRNHPKGNKYTESELKKHRNSWYEKVKGNIGVSDRYAVVETDKHVYRCLTDVLPWGGSIAFLREHDFGAAYHSSSLKDIIEFRRYCTNAAFEFIDPDLEQMRARLQHLVEAFCRLAWAETFPANRQEFNEIPREWRVDAPKRYEAVLGGLNTGADDITEAYDELVRTATRKLGVLPVDMGHDSPSS